MSVTQYAVGTGKSTEQEVRNLTTEEAAWMGALVGGEGSISLRARVDGKWLVLGVNTFQRLDKADRITARQVNVYSSEPEIMSACLRLVGAGEVYYRPPRPDYVSPRGRRAFASKDMWEWRLAYKDLVTKFLAQIRPYLTGLKRDLAALAIPVAGSSCHPTHFEGPPDTKHNTPEQIEKNWEEFRKAHRVDPRAIDRHFKFKPGHEPDYAEPESGEVYVKIEGHEGEPSEPDQRHMLSGGELSGIPCEQCGTETHIAGEMSVWDIYHQPGVEVANLADITDERRRELQEQIIVVLKCPQCHHTYQWDAALLPKRL
jgi:hypothetical protein